MRSVAIDDESRIGEGRRIAAAMAREIGFNDADTGRVALIATELAANLHKHAYLGELLIGLYDDGDGAGVECLALDRGAGIPDVEACLRDGYSTAGTLGAGLGAIRRQSQAFEIYSPPGRGAVILARASSGEQAARGAPCAPLAGVVCLPQAGETACGDAFSVRRTDRGLAALVVDGLGHGPLAAAAAHAAVRVYERSEPLPAESLMQAMHAALRSTRGAAASAVLFPADQPIVTFAGVGNVAGVVVTDAETRRMVCTNGTLGHALRLVRPFSYPAAGDALVVLTSDGLATSWSLETYPGLRRRHPSVIAAVLYRDFSRGRDDVTVLVVRRQAE